MDRRDGEPTLWLMVEHKDAAAAYDLPFAYWEEHGKNLWGSKEKGDKAFSARGEIRTLKSNILVRELSFN